jgi:hypothetical protein
MFPALFYFTQNPYNLSSVCVLSESLVNQGSESKGECKMTGGLTIEQESKNAEEVFKQVLEEARKSSGNPEDLAPSTIMAEKPILDKAESTEEETEAETTDSNLSDSIPDFTESKLKDDLTYWKDRFEVVQGKYNAEVPRIAAENKELREQISQLAKTVDDLKLRAKQSETNTSETNSAISTIKAELGDSVAKALSDLIDAKAGNISKSYEEKASNLENRVQDNLKRQALTEKQIYIKDLKTMVPDLEKKNSDPKWRRWLMNTAPLSRGRTYQQLLDEANSSMDAGGVAEIFNSCPVFQNGHTRKEKPNIEDIIEPAKPKPGKHSDVGEKKIYSKAEVDKFRKDVLEGRYARDETTRQKLDAEYSNAFLEDRIR